MHQANPNLLNCNNEKPSGRWKSMYTVYILPIVTLFSFLPAFLDIVYLVCRLNIYTIHICVRTFLRTLLKTAGHGNAGYHIKMTACPSTFFILCLFLALFLAWEFFHPLVVAAFTHFWWHLTEFLSVSIVIVHGLMSWHFYSYCLKTNWTLSFEV